MKRIKQSRTFKKDAKTQRKHDKIKMHNEEFDDLDNWESMTPVKGDYDDNRKTSTQVRN